MSYGVFELDGKTIGILVILTIVFLMMATVMYATENRFVAGFGSQLLAVITGLTALITWWTAIEWSTPTREDSGSIGVVIGSVLLLAALGAPLAFKAE